MTVEKCVIIGSGPAGYTAALYTARANLKPVLIAGMVPGGQLTTTTEVENFPGFPEGLMGPQLMENMAKQCERFGTRIIQGQVKKVELSGKIKTITTNKEEYQAHTVIIATGAQSILLGIPGEKELMGKGVSTCATCDGFFYRGKKIAVVGGGDSAMEEATFLTKFADKVTIIHRREELRASKIMQQRAKDNPKVEWLLNTIPLAAQGKENLESLRVKNVKSGEESDLAVDGVFVAIGHKPSTELFKDQLETNDKGYLVVKDGSKTNLAGVFAAGDVHDAKYRQAITAAGAGCIAALDAEHYLQEIGEG